MDPAKWLMKLSNFRSKPADVAPHEREQKWLCQCGKENDVLQLTCPTCTRAVTADCNLLVFRAPPEKIKDRLTKCVAGLKEAISQVEWFQKLDAAGTVIWQYTAASYKYKSPYQKAGSFCWKSFDAKSNALLESASHARLASIRTSPRSSCASHARAADSST